jgi:glycosyltransferase involved in cell wall biosynthesis
MTAWPTVMIVLITYNRPKEIRRTIRALQGHLHYEGTVQLHIADDGSAPGYLDEIRADFPARFVHSVSVTPHKGWAVNANTALRQAFSETPFVFLIEDDYVAIRHLDLSRGVSLLEAVPRLGLVRYDGIEGHKFMLRLCEADTRIGRVHYLWIQKDSPATYIYSNRPHLVHARFHRQYGYYSGGLALGSTEMVFAEKFKFTEGPEIAVLSDGVDRAFDHIGHSWKGSPHDVGKEIVYE